MKKFIAAALTVMLSFPVYAEKLSKSPNAVRTIEYLDISDDRTIVLKGPIDDKLSYDVSAKLFANDEESHEPILLIIDSPGGSVEAGMGIINQMKDLKSPLVCAVSGQAFSMAAIIASYCPKLYVRDLAMLMFHQASFGAQGSAGLMQGRVGGILKFLKTVELEVAANLGISYEEYHHRIDNEWWITGHEAVAMGFATAVVKHLPYAPIPPAPESIFGRAADILKLLFSKIF